MSKTETVLDLLPGDVLVDGFIVTAPARVTTLGGRIVSIVNGHYGNNVLTHKKFYANVPVSVVPSC